MSCPCHSDQVFTYLPDHCKFVEVTCQHLRPVLQYAHSRPKQNKLETEKRNREKILLHDSTTSVFQFFFFCGGVVGTAKHLRVKTSVQRNSSPSDARHTPVPSQEKMDIWVRAAEDEYEALDAQRDSCLEICRYG